METIIASTRTYLSHLEMRWILSVAVEYGCVIGFRDATDDNLNWRLFVYTNSLIPHTILGELLALVGGLDMELVCEKI